MIYKADELKDWNTDANIEGMWVVARPLNYKHQSLKERIQEAWGVLIGKYDTLEWYKQ
jgi:hypothetical protein